MEKIQWSLHIVFNPILNKFELSVVRHIFIQNFYFYNIGLHKGMITPVFHFFLLGFIIYLAREDQVINKFPVLLPCNHACWYPKKGILSGCVSYTWRR